MVVTCTCFWQVRLVLAPALHLLLLIVGSHFTVDPLLLLLLRTLFDVRLPNIGRTRGINGIIIFINIKIREKKATRDSNICNKSTLIFQTFNITNDPMRLCPYKMPSSNRLKPKFHLDQSDKNCWINQCVKCSTH